MLFNAFKERGYRFGRHAAPFTMETGSMENVMDMVPTVYSFQGQSSMKGSTVGDGRMEKSMYVCGKLPCTITKQNYTLSYVLFHFLSLQGYGTYFYSNSAVYEGEWAEDQRSGWGRMYYENGDIYEGEWMKDKNHGQGIIRFGERTFFKPKI